jgi:protein-tyrosine phosphatase
MGNICRSPTAEGVFRNLVAGEALESMVYTDSAGTHAFHVGSAPDKRAREAAARRGVDLSNLRARQVELEDFSEFDYLLAMDEDNLELLVQLSPEPGYRSKVRLLLDFAPELGASEVPDPYYGGTSGFERVLDLVEIASKGLLTHIRREHSLSRAQSQRE